MVMSFFAPSPSRAIACARFSNTCAMASSTRGNSWGSGRTPEAPFASRSRVSLVDVSPSTVIEWKDRSTACRKAGSRYEKSIFASVTMNDSIVAIFGWIIPDPLANPKTRTPPASEEATFGNVSVVMFA